MENAITKILNGFTEAHSGPFRLAVEYFRRVRHPAVPGKFALAGLVYYLTVSNCPVFCLGPVVIYYNVGKWEGTKPRHKGFYGCRFFLHGYYKPRIFIKKVGRAGAGRKEFGRFL